MSKIKILLLKISLFLVFTQGLWERLLSFSTIVSVFVELSVILFIAYPVKNIFTKAPGYLEFLIFLIIGYLVSIANGSSTVSWFKYIRYFIYFYIIYNQLWNNVISKKRWIKIFHFIVFLVILQGIGSFVNIFILNKRVEGYVGLMSSLGGTTATTYPLLIISLGLLIWFFSKRKNLKLNILILLSVASAVLVGYSSGKRAIYFVIPIFILIISLISIVKLGLKTNFYKKMSILIGIVILFAPVFIYGIVTSQGFNYGLSGNEDSLGIIENTIEYALNYEDSESQEGATIGRSNTTKLLVINSINNKDQFLFGNGYGITKSEDSKSNLGIGYGIVGFTRDIISGGWLIMMLSVLIFLRIILTGRLKYKTKLSSSIRILLLFIFVFIHFGYSSDFIVHLKISFLIAIICSFLYSPKQSKPSIEILGSNFY